MYESTTHQTQKRALVSRHSSIQPYEGALTTQGLPSSITFSASGLARCSDISWEVSFSAGDVRLLYCPAFCSDRATFWGGGGSSMLFWSFICPWSCCKNGKCGEFKDLSAEVRGLPMTWEKLPFLLTSNQCVVVIVYIKLWVILIRVLEHLCW